MKFKGDIIITDPCYICKPKDYSQKIGEEPKHNDYFPYADEKEYSDAIEVVVPEEEIPDFIKNMREILKNARPEIVQPPYTEWHSKMYDACKEKYDKAYDKYYEANASDWERTEHGENMEVLGIQTYLCRDTLYGDWSCTTFDSDTNEQIGEFCADAGMVGVFLLDEVLQYNPDYRDYTDCPGAVTLIKDFDGDIEIMVVQDENGEPEVRVIGNGNINFYTRQTGFQVTI